MKNQPELQDFLKDFLLLHAHYVYFIGTAL